jgi:hypothetical protein
MRAVQRALTTSDGAKWARLREEWAIYLAQGNNKEQYDDDIVP